MSSQQLFRFPQNIISKIKKFDKGIGARLPEAYKKFYKEWQLTEPSAVHYIPEEGNWKRDEVTGEVFPVQNFHIPLQFPPEAENHIWGGEGVVQGFQKRNTKNNRRVPHFWVPTLKRSVVYSEVLDNYMSVIITDKALNIIHEHYGFDHYLLKTPACDLRLLLPLRLKRKILEELQNGCPAYQNNPEKQKAVLSRYSQYLTAYTAEEIEWYGYTFQEACAKLEKSLEAQNRPVPLKQIYRTKLIEKLHQNAASNEEVNQEITKTVSWIEKINPFGKKHET
ncbi:39S ribosomal protein L28, mitochondrial [Agrilus planipennis]|uniref:39S ribosomal protein L28, mitochondrial n=1 Tax=Agrilus planipennis TaxID=224129 RepID=A0A1W4X6M7_AGRPL|nr:39S ribosomal protein L28, mitochondrial [Agrilus planipennis]